MKLILNTARIIALCWVAQSGIVSAQAETIITETSVSPDGYPDPADPADPAKLTAATRLVDAVMPPENRVAMIDAMLRPMMQNIQAGITNNPEFQKIISEDAEFKNIFDRFLQKQNERIVTKLHQELPAMITAMSYAYARQFSLQEMADTTAFFNTPSGRTYMTKASSIMSDPGVAKWQQSLTTDMMANISSDMTEFTAEITAHLAKSKKRARK